MNFTIVHLNMLYTVSHAHVASFTLGGHYVKRFGEHRHFVEDGDDKYSILF